MKHDAANRNVEIYDPLAHPCCENNHLYTNTFDGNGWRTRSADASTPPGGSAQTTTTFEFHSTVLGGATVGKMKTYSWNSNTQHEFIAPVNGVELYYSDVLGTKINWTAPDGVRTFGQDEAELDTRGADVGMENPYNTSDGSTGYPATGGDPTNYGRCAEGGEPVPCDMEARISQRFSQIEARLPKHKPTKSPKGQDSPIKIPRPPGDGNPGDKSALAKGPTDKPKGDDCPTGFHKVEGGCAVDDGHVEGSVEVRADESNANLIVDSRSYINGNGYGNWIDWGNRLRSTGREPLYDKEELERIRRATQGPPPEIPCVPGTLQLGIHGTGALGPFIGTAGTGLAIDGSGNVGWYYEGGVGGGFGARARGGIQGTVSNANQINGLEGSFWNAGGGGGAVGDGQASFGTGTNNYTGEPVGTTSISAGGGGGASGGFTRTYTGFVVPPVNVWDALGFRRRSQNGCR